MPPGTRKPVTSRLPPIVTAPPPGSTLNYAAPVRPRKPWPRRAWNWVRYHLEDRVGNAIMWTVGSVVVGLIAFVIYRPVTTARLLLHFFGGE